MRWAGKAKQLFCFEYVMQVMDTIDNLVASGNNKLFADNEVNFLILCAACRVRRRKWRMVLIFRKEMAIG